MKLLTALFLIGLFTQITFADDNTFGFGRCKIPAHHHDSRYAMKGHIHNYDDLEFGEPLVLKPRPKPKANPHCRLETWGEHESVNGRCLYNGDVVTSVVGGRVYCSRTIVRCNYSDAFFKKLFGRNE